MPVASAFDIGSRRFRLPTVHSKIHSTENSEEPHELNRPIYPPPPGAPKVTVTLKSPQIWIFLFCATPAKSLF
jgi:hypothetical protein